MKNCFKCGEVKPRTEFYRHPKMADGLLGKCKTCTKKDSLRTRHGNLENVRAYDRARGSLPHRKILAVRVMADWRKKHPEREHAQSALNWAVKIGLVKKLPCFVCGLDAEAHHPDYDRPLDVVWLCSAHHKQAHALVRK